MKHILAILAVALLISCTAPAESSQPAQDHTLKVAVSFYPLQFFSEQVGGTHVDVTNLIPPGVGTHDWEPSPKDIRVIQDANVFVYNSVGEPWSEKVIGSLDASRIVLVDVSKGIDLLEAEHHDKHEEDEHEGKEHDEHEDHEEAREESHADEAEHEESDHAQEHKESEHDKHTEESAHETGSKEHDLHDHGGIDPHIWLDPVLVQEQVRTIKEEFIKAAPAHSQTFESNAQAFIKDLQALDAQFKDQLRECKQEAVLTSHLAFRYLAERYGFEHVSVTGLLHEEEPSAKSIAEFVEFVKEHEIKYVMTEALISPRVAETIAEETNAQVLTLNPIEGLTKQQIGAGETWMTLMEQNLKNLKKALECQ